MRFGIGYDVHRLVPGRKLIVGGISIEHPTGLDGHSDADVLAHAIGDALLGAAALGDLGTHFPNTDQRYRGISSMLLLQEINSLLRKHDYTIVHVDSTLTIEQPKISPYRDQIRGSIARALGLNISQVSVKATTGEGLGFVGHGEGAAAWAVATISGGSHGSTGD